MGRARGHTAVAHGASRRGGQPPEKPFGRERLQQLCAAYGMDAAAALTDNRFYHVACREDLARIGAEGLLPLGESGRERNFSEYHVDEQCVYLWPSVGIAQAYAFDHPERFAGRERVILQVSGLDVASVGPDQEILSRLWEEVDELDDASELLARAHEEAGGGFAPPGSELTFKQAAELIRRLPAETRVLLANLCAIRGEAVMVRHAIPVQELSLAELNDFESLDAEFDETHPDLDPWASGDFDEEVEERRESVRDEWFEQRLSEGAQLIDVDTLKEQLQDVSELVDNDELVYYTVRPLNPPAL